MPVHDWSRVGAGVFHDFQCTWIVAIRNALNDGLLPPDRGALWEEIGDAPYVAPSDKPLTLAAYSAGPIKTAYVEPVAVGDALPDMPLFLDPESHVYVPLEATYQTAWRGVARRWRSVLEAQAP